MSTSPQIGGTFAGTFAFQQLAPVKSPEDAALFCDWFKQLYAYAHAKFASRLSSLPSALPFPKKEIQEAEGSVTSYLAQTMILCEAAGMYGVSGDDFLWMKAIYICCLYASGPEFTEEQIFSLKAWGKGVSGPVRTFLSYPGILAVGKLDKLEAVLQKWEFLDTKVADISTKPDPKSFFFQRK